MTEPTLLSLVISTLAVWQIVEILHHSERFARLRAGAEHGTDVVSRVLLCPWCLSVWIALPVVVLSLFRQPSDEVLLNFLNYLSRLFLYVMAVSRLANLGNDYFYDVCRTPDPNREIGMTIALPPVEIDEHQQHE